MNYKCKDCGNSILEESGRCDRCSLSELQEGNSFEEPNYQDKEAEN
jgi:hypothetical protein